MKDNFITSEILFLYVGKGCWRNYGIIPKSLYAILYKVVNAYVEFTVILCKILSTVILFNHKYR